MFRLLLFIVTFDIHSAAVAAELDALPFVFEFGADLYRKHFVGRPHVAFVGRIVSDDAALAATAGGGGGGGGGIGTGATSSGNSSVHREPLVVCVSLTPVPVRVCCAA